MLSYQILDYYEFINTELEVFGEILKPIFTWSQSYLKYSTDSLTKLLKSNTVSSSDGTHYIIKDGGIKTGYDENVKNMKSIFSSYIIFKAFGEFQQKINQYKDKNNIVSDDYITDFMKETENLFETYQEFQKEDTNQIKMINFVTKLEETLKRSEYDNLEIQYNPTKRDGIIKIDGDTFVIKTFNGDIGNSYLSFSTRY